MDKKTEDFSTPIEERSALKQLSISADIAQNIRNFQRFIIV